MPVRAAPRATLLSPATRMPSCCRRSKPYAARSPRRRNSRPTSFFRTGPSSKWRRRSRQREMSFPEFTASALSSCRSTGRPSSRSSGTIPMPELPEVETVRRGLEPAMVGARIERVELRRNDIRFPFPPRFRERLTARKVLSLARRAKYLLFELDSGETLIAHLGMSGSFRIDAAKSQIPGAFHHERSKDPKHDHVVLDLDNGNIITYNDPRRFGFMDLIRSDALNAHPRLSGLGEEPLALEFDAARLAKLFGGSRAPMKAALLDQKRIAGLGNIYVCEALFRARLDPKRPASVLANARGGPTRSAG